MHVSLRHAKGRSFVVFKDAVICFCCSLLFCIVNFLARLHIFLRPGGTFVQSLPEFRSIPSKAC